MNLETMTIEKLDYGVHVVTIYNPPANTLNAGIQQDLVQLIEEVEKNPAIRAISGSSGRSGRKSNRICNIACSKCHWSNRPH